MSYTSQEVLKAKSLLGLSEEPTLAEIKYAYKSLMHTWHPDQHLNDIQHATEMSVLINNAYAIVSDFCKQYRFDLSETSITRRAQTPQEWWKNRFGH